MPLYAREIRKRDATWSEDDYEVVNEHGDVIGRIYRTQAGTPETQWRWFINGAHLAGLVNDTGYTGTREDAQAAFARNWRRWLEIKGLPEDYRPEHK
jgi:hypothetical protein